MKVLSKYAQNLQTLYFRIKKAIIFGAITKLCPMEKWTKFTLKPCFYCIFILSIFSSNLCLAQYATLPEVDVQPTFPGGLAALRQYLDTNLDFPDVIDIAEEKIVIVEFIVDSVGKVDQPKVIWYNNDTARTAALALIYKMPKWTPAVLDNQPASSVIRLPITYYRPANKSNTTSDHVKIPSTLRETLYFDINFIGARTKAEFPGGLMALKSYLAKNLEYPQEAKEKGVSGLVLIELKIGKTGALEDYQVVEGIGAGCDEEALRLMDMMPDWTPATLDGQPIAAQRSIKIPFKLKTSADSIYKVVDQMPSFPDGHAALLRFLAENIQYPTMAKENEKQGMVVVQFIVEKDGSLSNMHVVKGFDKECDEEAVRVMRVMPKWQPGLQRKQPVRVQFNLPIRFKLG